MPQSNSDRIGPDYDKKTTCWSDVAVMLGQHYSSIETMFRVYMLDVTIALARSNNIRFDKICRVS